VHDRTKNTAGPEAQKFKFPLLLFHQQYCEKYAILFHAIVNNALGLVVDI
jgi:hypothetical protein